MMFLDGINYWQILKIEIGICFEIRFFLFLRYVYKDIKIKGNRRRIEVWREYIIKELFNLVSD